MENSRVFGDEKRLKPNIKTKLISSPAYEGNFHYKFVSPYN